MSEKKARSGRACDICNEDKTFHEAAEAALFLIDFLSEHEPAERALLSQRAEGGISGLLLEIGHAVLSSSIRTTRPFMNFAVWRLIGPLPKFVALLEVQAEYQHQGRHKPTASVDERDF